METWRPHPGPQEEFCKRGEYEVLFGGAKGPGKSDALIADATRGIEHPRYHGLLLRRTFPRLQEIIDRCYEIYPKLGGEYKTGIHRWTFPSGARITLGHVQHEEDKRNWHGKEFHYIGFDELTEFTKTQYFFILANVRRAKAGLDLKIRGTTNPGGIGHVWVKEHFVDVCKPTKKIKYMAGDGEMRDMWIPKIHIDPKTGTSRTFVPATVYDNASIMLYDPAYVRRLENLPEVERRRLLLGEWDVFEGQAFVELSQVVHGCEPFDIPPEWEKFMSFDWGYSAPFSVGWYALDYDGVLYRYREWYGCSETEGNVGLRMTTNDIARGILDREKEKIKFRVADPRCWGRTPLGSKGGKPIFGPPVAEDMAREGVFMIKADNDRLSGKMQVHKRFQIEEEIDPETGEVHKEYPRILIFNDQKYFWKTMPQIRLDERNPEDIDTEQEDHIYDEFRYACMARPIIPKRRITVPPGTFAAERNRLINAKRYARRHNVSLEIAYQRIR